MEEDQALDREAVSEVVDGLGTSIQVAEVVAVAGSPPMVEDEGMVAHLVVLRMVVAMVVRGHLHRGINYEIRMTVVICNTLNVKIYLFLEDNLNAF